MASHVDVIGMEVGGNGRPRNAVDTSRMVDVSMCDEHSDRCQVVPRQEVRDAGWIRWRVDHDRCRAGSARHDPAIRTEVPQDVVIYQGRHEQTIGTTASEDESVGVVDRIDLPEGPEKALECITI